jgi:hypothetical protein
MPVFVHASLVAFPAFVSIEFVARSICRGNWKFLPIRLGKNCVLVPEGITDRPFFSGALFLLSDRSRVITENVMVRFDREI